MDEAADMHTVRNVASSEVFGCQFTGLAKMRHLCRPWTHLSGQTILNSPFSVLHVTQKVMREVQAFEEACQDLFFLFFFRT